VKALWLLLLFPSIGISEESMYDWIKERPDSIDWEIPSWDCGRDTVVIDTLRVYLDKPGKDLSFIIIPSLPDSVPPDTVVVPPDTVVVPPDTTVIPPDTTYIVSVEAEDYVDYFDTTPGNSFGPGCGNNDDVDLKFNTDNDSTCIVGLFATGEWLRYDVEIPKSGHYLFEARVSSAVDNSTFQLEIDSVVVTEIAIPRKASWNIFTTIAQDSVFLLQGIRDIRIIRGSNWLDMNWFRFTLGDTTFVPPDTTTVPPDTTGSAPGDTVWAETQLGFIDRLAREAVADSQISYPDFARRDSLYDAGVRWGSPEWFQAGEDILWNYDQWFEWYYEKFWFDPPAEWPSWYWNPPPEYPLRYPIKILDRRDSV
jgi:hypothetical protein